MIGKKSGLRIVVLAESCSISAGLFLAVLWVSGRVRTPPFFFDTRDVFMDYFNTLYWSYRPDAVYSSWNSVYSPVAHAWLLAVDGVFSVEASSFDINVDSFEMRSQWLRYGGGIFIQLCCFVATLFADCRRLCIAVGFPRVNRGGCFLTLFVLTSPLGLFALDRMNTMFWAYSLLSISLMSIRRSAGNVPVWAIVTTALACHIKTYLFPFMFLLLWSVSGRDLFRFAASAVIMPIISVIIYDFKASTLLLSNQINLIRMVGPASGGVRAWVSVSWPSIDAVLRLLNPHFGPFAAFAVNSCAVLVFCSLVCWLAFYRAEGLASLHYRMAALGLIIAVFGIFTDVMSPYGLVLVIMFLGDVVVALGPVGVRGFLGIAVGMLCFGSVPILWGGCIEDFPIGVFTTVSYWTNSSVVTVVCYTKTSMCVAVISGLIVLGLASILVRKLVIMRFYVQQPVDESNGSLLST